MIYGGIEVYKTAGKILLRIFLPAPVAAALDPAVDAMVQQRAELFVNTLKAAQARDERRLGELAVEAYVTLNLPLVQGCALIPAGAFKEVTCGNMGKALQALSEGGGEVTSFVVDTTKDALDAVGLLDPVDEIISGRVLSGKEKPEICGTSERWYATNYLQCLHRGAYLVGKDLNGLLGSLNAACRDNYIRCHIGSTVDRICPPLNASFAKQALDAHNGLVAAADAYTRSIRSYIESKGARACEPDFEQIEIAQFVGECESALRKAIPLAGDPTNADCRAPAQQFSAPSAHREACRWAVEQSNARYVMRDVCFNCGGAKDVEREWNLAAEAWVRSLRWWVGLHTADFCAAGADVRAATSRFVDACEGQLKSASMPVATRCALGARQSPAAPRDACLRALPQVEGVGPSAVVQEMCDYCRSSPGSCAPGPVPPPATMATRPPRLVPPPPVAPPPPSTIAAQPPRLVPPPSMQMPADNMPLKPPHLVLPAPTSPPPPVVATRPPPVALPTPVVCPAGSVFRGGRCIQDIAKAPPRCRDGMVPKAGGGCDCPPGSVFRSGRCIQGVAKAPPRCRDGMVPKAGGGCDCPPGSVFRGGTCAAAACSGGMIGTPPNCRCPQGTVWRRAGLGKARCLPPAAPKAACPPGMARDSTGFCGPK
jgi:hypothetical protein